MKKIAIATIAILSMGAIATISIIATSKKEPKVK